MNWLKRLITSKINEDKNKTKEIRQIFDVSKLQASSSPVAKLKSADYAQILEIASAEFVDDVWKNHEAEMKALGYETLGDLQKALQDPESGAVNFSKVLGHLNPEERVKFAQAVEQYTVETILGQVDLENDPLGLFQN
mgnify:CR=1 FL=1